MVEEDWRCTPYPGYYASSLGRIRGRSSAVMAGVVNKATGYIQYTIIVAADRQRKVTGHQLVCEAFHGPCPEVMEVAPRNGDKLDNRADNLRWATHKDNCIERSAHNGGRRKRAKQ